MHGTTMPGMPQVEGGQTISSMRIVRLSLHGNRRPQPINIRTVLERCHRNWGDRRSILSPAM